MRAVALMHQGDDSSQLQLTELPEPIVTSAYVLVKVIYASLNPVDYKLINNQPDFWQYPYVPGLDCVGEVVSIGKGCTKFRPGDKVAVHGNLTFGGALAEYIAQPEHVLIGIPDGFDLKLAAALPCAGLTAYLALVRKMNVKAGKTIFIHGSSGGVGSFATIIAKALGLVVIGSCSTKNIDYVRNLGADTILDYSTTDVYAAVETQFPDGVDYILETITKENLQKDIKILAFNGQIASIVGILDTHQIREFSTGFGFHEVALGGAYLSGHYPSQCDLAQMGNELIDLLLSQNKQPRINEYSFDEVLAAFHDLQSGKNSGKIVVKIG